MSETLIDSRASTASRTITATVAKIPPVIIAAAAALGAYETAPLMVDYFQLNRPLYLTTPDIRPNALPEVKRTTAPEPLTESVSKQMAPAPVVRQMPDEPPSAPVAIVVPPTMTPLAPRMAVRPALRGRFFRVRPATPGFRFARGFSGYRAALRIGHVVPLLNFVRRFHR
jgi:hypothetical protein